MSAIRFGGSTHIYHIQQGQKLLRKADGVLFNVVQGPIVSGPEKAQRANFIAKQTEPAYPEFFPKSIGQSIARLFGVEAREERLHIKVFKQNEKLRTSDFERVFDSEINK